MHVTMHIPQTIQAWTKEEPSVLLIAKWLQCDPIHFFPWLIWTPAIDHITDHLNNTCIGVMHIVDTYASSVQNSSSFIAVKGQPLTLGFRIMGYGLLIQASSKLQLSPIWASLAATELSDQLQCRHSLNSLLKSGTLKTWGYIHLWSYRPSLSADDFSDRLHHLSTVSPQLGFPIIQYHLPSRNAHKLTHAPSSLN